MLSLQQKVHYPERAWQRHIRYTNPHRTGHGEPIESWICEVEDCAKSFTRADTRDRHEQEHHLGGKEPCSCCGKRLRARLSHNHSKGEECAPVPIEKTLAAGNVTVVGVERPSDGNEHPIDNPELCDRLCFTRDEGNSLESLIPALMLRPPRKVHSNKANGLVRYVLCGICRKVFERIWVLRTNTHLSEHFQSLKEGRWCAECQVSFAQEGDLARHLSSAAKGDCGFASQHKDPYSGHHSPFGNNRNDDRFNFTYRQLQWGQAQLRSFTSRLQQLTDGLGVQRTSVSCPHQSIGTRPIRPDDVAISVYSVIDRSNHQSRRFRPTLGHPVCLSVSIYADVAASHVSDAIPSSQRDMKSSSYTSGLDNFPWNMCRNEMNPSGSISAPGIAEAIPDPDLDGEGGAGWTNLLARLVRTNDIEVVEPLLEAGIRPETLDTMGSSAFHHAAISGCLHTARSLFEHGIPDDVPIATQAESPLSLSIINNAFDVANLLLQHGAIGHATIDDSTALHVATALSNEELALKYTRLLLSYNARVNVRDDCGRVPLDVAWTSGNFRVTEPLVSRGARSSDHKRETSIFVDAAVHYQQQVTPQLLSLSLEGGANVRATGGPTNSSPITTALRQDMQPSVHSIEWVIKAGVDVNHRDIDGVSAIQAAAMRGHDQCLETLIEAGAVVNSRNGKGVSALHAAVRAGHTLCVETLIRANADFNTRDDLGLSALHAAVENHHDSYFEMLVAAGADSYQIGDIDGGTLTSLLQTAIIHHRGTCVSVLMRHGARGDAGSISTPIVERLVPTWRESQWELAGVMRQLLQCGAHLDGPKEPPLFHAIYSHHETAVLALLELGADAHMNYYDQTPLEYAHRPHSYSDSLTQPEHSKIVRLLRMVVNGKGSRKIQSG